MYILIILGAILYFVVSSARRRRAVKRRAQTQAEPGSSVAHTETAKGVEPAVSAERLADWKAAIDVNALPALRLHLTGEPATELVGSKVGGQAGWPDGRDYPTCAAGQPLHLLAQINFAEIDDTLATLPSAGLLQFFIAAGDLYGCDFTRPVDGKPREYAVAFHERPELLQPFPAPPVTDDDLLPHRGESAIRFERFDSKASPLDYRFDRILPDVGHDEHVEPLYDYALTQPAHQIGGYASFTQQDPRDGRTPDDEWVLLLQLDSQTVGALDMMWGDVGIANFFIRPQDLARRDFSRVWYNWDCS